MANMTVPLTPFVVPTTVSLIVDITPKTEGYETPAATVLIATLDVATRQALIDDFAAAILAK